MARIIIVWGLWGPYHCSRFMAFRDHAARMGHTAIGVSHFAGSRVNQWRAEKLPEGVVHIDLGHDETKFPWSKTGKLLATPRRTGANVALLPSYFNWSLALNLAVRLAGGRVVMMNESHAGTARAKGLKAALKQRVVAGFHGGFVGGAPHVRYFASLGMPEDRIFTGYDAVDNDYFAGKAKEVGSRESEARNQYGLPERYFLSLGRFVPKKNLDTLIRAYAMFLNSQPSTLNPQSPTPHLVMVGSGETEPRLRALCAELTLPIHEHPPAGPLSTDHRSLVPGVHFYGFRQIDENPVFYALAEAFILPSLYEEWGLVVNEAMACGLPVIVSETAGCAEDLLEAGYPLTEPSPDLIRVLNSAGLSTRIRKNGFVFDPQSPEELGCVLKFVADSSALRAVMGQHSLRIVERFSCENFARNAMLAVDAALASK